VAITTRDNIHGHSTGMRGEQPVGNRREHNSNAEEMLKAAKEAKVIWEKYGAEFLRLSRFHTGAWAGEWLVTLCFSSSEVYRKVQEAAAKDDAFAKLLARTASFAELTGRNIAVGVEI
jgi:hypothetical protein